MKTNLIGMILNNAGRRCFDGAILDDNGKPMPAADSLHHMIMEYAKVVNGGTSETVITSREVLTFTRDPVKRKPTGFIATCQCGAIVGAMDRERTEQREAAGAPGQVARGRVHGGAEVHRLLEGGSGSVSLQSRQPEGASGRKSSPGASRKGL